MKLSSRISPPSSVRDVTIAKFNLSSAVSSGRISQVTVARRGSNDLESRE